MTNMQKLKDKQLINFSKIVLKNTVCTKLGKVKSAIFTDDYVLKGVDVDIKGLMKSFNKAVAQALDEVRVEKEARDKYGSIRCVRCGFPVMTEGKHCVDYYNQAVDQLNQNIKKVKEG